MDSPIATGFTYFETTPLGSGVTLEIRTAPRP